MRVTRTVAVFALALLLALPASASATLPHYGVYLTLFAVQIVEIENIGGIPTAMMRPFPIGGLPLLRDIGTLIADDVTGDISFIRVKHLTPAALLPSGARSSYFRWTTVPTSRSTQ